MVVASLGCYYPRDFNFYVCEYILMCHTQYVTRMLCEEFNIDAVNSEHFLS